MLTMRRSTLVRRALAVLTIAASLIVAGAQPAASGPLPYPYIIDTFDNAYVWAGYHGPSGEAYVSNTAGGARTGPNSGFLAQSGTSFWASLERLFTSPANKTCNMWIWLKATSTTGGHLKFNVEIIEPASFTYVALKPVEYSNNVPFGYAKYVVGPWRTTTHQQLLFRVSLFGAAGPFGDAAFIDDMTLYCA
jgi:hypothetical protein